MKFKKIFSFLLNIFLGLITFWLFIIAYALALNIDGHTDTEFIKPFGWIALFVLVLVVIGINLAIFNKLLKIKHLIIFQICPFLIGFAISLWYSFKW